MPVMIQIGFDAFAAMSPAVTVIPQFLTVDEWLLIRWMFAWIISRCLILWSFIRSMERWFGFWDRILQVCRFRFGSKDRD